MTEDPTTTTGGAKPITIDPNDVSAILFQKKTDPPLIIDPYVGPVEISCDKVAHGRGLVASRTIAAGELLFATPPTVEASIKQVFDKWQAKRMEITKESNDDNDFGCLEECAEAVLLDAMEQACEQEPAVAASFAALVGSPLDEQQHTTTPPAIAVLLGQDEKAGKDLPNMTREHMLKIVRANAFGPDGLHSYQNVEETWLQAQKCNPINEKASVDALIQQTPRLLGLYPFADMVNHSCLANAVRVYAAGNIMLVHALTEIPQGTEIVYSYVPPSQPNRRPALEQQHGFVCHCARCVAEEQAKPVLINDKEASLLLEFLQSWNHPRLAQFPSYSQLHKAIRTLEDVVLPLPDLTNEVRRYLRISYLHVYIHYFNVALANVQAERDDFVANILRNDLLILATQLHFSFCACHNASTEHLSVRHSFHYGSACSVISMQRENIAVFRQLLTQFLSTKRSCTFAMN